ncbi:hypothetical protein TELCIR_06057 [Teladorsagia circumcincta]|uniref:EGF-like domain-containing protein n=1 Tax=Teladorsagia circumcincta TaxID=45464 RepID=A0A2G9UP83_TELCI|nr:hypothetical protein TELCIR_06057 [Teladorsagia circumcincta]
MLLFSCQSGQCRCQYGFIAVSGHCVALPVPTTPIMKNVVLARPLDSCDNEIELGERPVPVSYAKHKVEILSPERITEHDEFTDNLTSQMASTRTPSRQDTQRPRIVGPPIRRPRPKPKSSSSGSSGPGNYKSGSSGSGLSLRKLKYGQLCHNGKDTCTYGAVCIDSVCKCGPGYALSTNGWCEPFDFKPSAKNGYSYAQFTKPVITTMVSTRPPTPFTNYAVQGSQYATVSQYGHVDPPTPLTSPPTQQPQYPTSPAPKVVRHRFLGTKCRDNDVCINGGECLGGICQCPENLFERDGRCLRGAGAARTKCRKFGRLRTHGVHFWLISAEGQARFLMPLRVSPVKMAKCAPAALYATMIPKFAYALQIT